MSVAPTDVYLSDNKNLIKSEGLNSALFKHAASIIEHPASTCHKITEIIIWVTEKYSKGNHGM